MGEGGIDRHDLLYEMQWWEVIRCYYGIQRRYRATYDTARQRDYIYISAHWDRKNGSLPGSAQEWNPHSWDPLPKKPDEEEIRALIERCRAENRAANS